MQPIEFKRNEETVECVRPMAITYSAHRVYDGAKRVLDVFFSSLALVVLAPFMGLLALIIWLDDPHGSPIYVSKRCGKNGKQFSFYKFRSMCVNADKLLEGLMDQNEADGPAFKIKKDPRLTRVGRFIRKCSIDELPQLINILRGDMSIVGPRPPIAREVEQYTSYQMKRLSVKPGLTCLWQVQPHRNDLSFDEWVELDIKYIRERCLALDAKLVLLTIWSMLSMSGV